jgi:DNA primase
LEKERGLSPETQRAFQLGYNPANLYDAPARWGLDGRKI